MTRRSAVVLGLILCACQSTGSRDAVPIFSERQSDEALRSVQRVMVLPMQNADGVTAETEQVRDSLARALVRTGRFEVRPLPDGSEEQSRIYDSVRRATLAPRDLVALGERYQIDAVVLGTVTSFRPYEPPQFGLRTRMLSLHDGSTLWQAEAVLDASDDAVAADVRRYAEDEQAEETSLHGWRMTFLSPRRFIDYGTSRIASTLR
ncbi:MAG: hypothetical protein AAF196_14005 [Planctomycetota bacterium]